MGGLFVGWLGLLSALPFFTAVGYRDAALHLTVGFYFFLRENLPAISSDAGTWGPGLGAFLTAVLVSHFYLRAWAAKRNRRWSFGTTFCLLLIVPVLFVISFLVPGVLLQAGLLRDVPWFERQP